MLVLRCFESANILAATLRSREGKVVLTPSSHQLVGKSRACSAPGKDNVVNSRPRYSRGAAGAHFHSGLYRNVINAPSEISAGTSGLISAWGDNRLQGENMCMFHLQPQCIILLENRRHEVG